MDRESFRRVREAFERLLELPAAEREQEFAKEFLDAPELREELRRMLEADSREDAFLVPPSENTLAERGAGTAASLSLVGRRLGPFVIERRIASGGMGAVYEARQENPARKVAIKTIRPEALSEASRKRFRREAMVLARLQHPAIAQILEAGIEEADGTELPWFAMELVQGATTITEYADRAGLDARGRIELFLQFCDAVAHGHQRGVLHRDLKPSNLLVDGEAHPKVIDFGIARIQDAEEEGALELTGRVGPIGTLLYMSPEQIEEGGAGQDVRSDVYSMGLVLFELLTGRHPFPVQGISITEIVRSFKERRPETVTVASKDFPRDLDWILQKALANEKERRYASMQEFAADLRRLLVDEPVDAVPMTRLYRARKFVRRHRAAVLAGCAVLLALILGLAGTYEGLLRARAAERLAVEERNRALTAMDFLVEVFSRANPAKGARDVRMVEGLDLVAKIFEKRFAKEKDLLAMLARMLGRTYLGLGSPKDAERYLEQSLALREELGGKDSVEAAKAAGDLVVLRLEQGRLDEAERLIATALPSLRKALGEKSAEVLSLRLREGDLLRLRGRRGRAVELLGAVVRDMDEVLGGTARPTLLAKSLLAGLYHESGKLDEAEPLYRAALAGFAERFGEEHPDTLSNQFNLAALLFSRGARNEATKMMRRVTEASIKTLGPTHRYTMRARSTLGAMLHLQRRLEEAAACYYAALEASLSLSKTSPDVQVLRSNIARLERERGRLDKAEPMLKELFAIRKETLGADHEKTLISQVELAEIALARKRTEEGLRLLTDGLAKAEAKGGGSGPVAYRFRYARGRAYLATGAFQDAERDLLRCEEIFVQADRRSSVRGRLLAPWALLRRLYLAWDKPEKAARFEGRAP